MQRIPTLLTTLGLLLAAACGGSAADDPADAADTPEAAASMAAVTEPMQLSERDIEQFITILQELKSLGERYDGDGDLNSVGEAIMANRAAHAIIRKHGYADLVRFQQVMYNVSAAMAANEMGDDAANVAASKQQLEAMKSQLPKEQYDMMVQAHEQMARMVSGQSAGNKALVARYADRIQAAVGN